MTPLLPPNLTRKLKLFTINWRKFKVKILGEPARFLGCDITRNKNIITLDQKAYIENLLFKSGMQDAYPTPLPMNPGWKPQEIDEPNKFDKK